MLNTCPINLMICIYGWFRRDFLLRFRPLQGCSQSVTGLTTVGGDSDVPRLQTDLSIYPVSSERGLDPAGRPSASQTQGLSGPLASRSAGEKWRIVSCTACSRHESFPGLPYHGAPPPSSGNSFNYESPFDIQTEIHPVAINIAPLIDHMMSHQTNAIVLGHRRTTMIHPSTCIESLSDKPCMRYGCGLKLHFYSGDARRNAKKECKTNDELEPQ